MPANLSLPQQAHQVLRSHLRTPDKVIDATCGNGHDTLFLAQQVAPSGTVYAFDIQAAALQATEKRLQATQLLANVRLINAGHQFMSAHIPLTEHGQIKAVMFNLGYLPHADKTVITRTDTTLAALNAAIGLLCPQGIITVLAYPGHAGGDEETEQVQRRCIQLPVAFNWQVLLSSQPKPTAPRLFVIEKT